MAITKIKKQEILKKLEEKFSQAKSLVFVGYEKLKTKEQERLRKLLKENNCEFTITKKTLLNLVLKKFKFKGLEKSKIEKEIGLVFGYQDEILPARIVFDFSKENENLKIKGGIFEKRFIDTSEVKFLAILPSKKVLQSQFIYSVRAPLTNFVNVLRGNIRSLIYILNILSQNFKNYGKNP